MCLFDHHYFLLISLRKALYFLIDFKKDSQFNGMMFSFVYLLGDFSDNNELILVFLFLFGR